MAEYTRKYPDAPTPDEIKQGYAPSTIRGTPFVKFLFWTFVGLAVSYAIGWGTLQGLQLLEEREDQVQYRRMAARAHQPFTGPRLQPSPGNEASPDHSTLDWQDMDNYSIDGAKGLKAKKLWAGEDVQYKSGYAGKQQISDQAVAQTAAAIRQWVAASATTQPAAGGKANDAGK
jgi:hypothetical protein